MFLEVAFFHPVFHKSPPAINTLLSTQYSHLVILPDFCGRGSKVLTKALSVDPSHVQKKKEKKNPSHIDLMGSQGMQLKIFILWSIVQDPCQIQFQLSFTFGIRVQIKHDDHGHILFFFFFWKRGVKLC